MNTYYMLGIELGTIHTLVNKSPCLYVVYNLQYKLCLANKWHLQEHGLTKIKARKNKDA